MHDVVKLWYIRTVEAHFADCVAGLDVFFSLPLLAFAGLQWRVCFGGGGGGEHTPFDPKRMVSIFFAASAREVPFTAHWPPGHVFLFQLGKSGTERFGWLVRQHVDRFKVFQEMG